MFVIRHPPSSVSPKKKFDKLQRLCRALTYFHYMLPLSSHRLACFESFTAKKKCGHFCDAYMFALLCQTHLAPKCLKIKFSLWTFRFAANWKTSKCAYKFAKRQKCTPCTKNVWDRTFTMKIKICQFKN